MALLPWSFQDDVGDRISLYNGANRISEERVSKTERNKYASQKIAMKPVNKAELH